YSFLDGASSPTDLVETAAEFGYPALALTDHDGVWGSMEFAKVCEELGLKAITGAELSVSLDRDRPASSASSEGGPKVGHITLLAGDRRGYSNLCRLLTKAHSHTRDGPGRTLSPPSVRLADIEPHTEGLICLSGCAGSGLVAGRWRHAGGNREAERLARRLLSLFGPDNLRIELQRPYWRHDRARNAWLAALAQRLKVPTVATGNVHSHEPAQSRLQDAFVAVRRGQSLEAVENWRRGPSSSALADPAAMAERFADHPEAVRETLRLAERIE